MGTITAVCISPAKGTPKENVHKALVKPNWGLENDAHGGNWHRQVSLLSYDKVLAFDPNLPHGAFGENLLVQGIDLAKLPVGTRLKCGTALLEVTQIGKECHNHCQIYHTVGDCIMPREGIFAKVLTEGMIQTGDNIETTLSAAVVTISDKGAAGQRQDTSGPAITSILTQAGYTVTTQMIIPDEQNQIETTLKNLTENLVLTTGGTGLSPRDVTPEATLAIAERNASGIAEAIRAYSTSITPRGMLSRGVAVTRGTSLIINLPGSPKAVQEILHYILPTITHGVETLCGLAAECARP